MASVIRGRASDIWNSSFSSASRILHIRIPHTAGEIGLAMPTCAATRSSFLNSKGRPGKAKRLLVKGGVSDTPAPSLPAYINTSLPRHLTFTSSLHIGLCSVLHEKMGIKVYALLGLCLASMLLTGSKAEQCGSQAGGALCPGSLCCSRFGWCGDTAAYCDPAQGCQSRCWGGSTPTPTPPSGGGAVASIITRSLFDEMLKHRNDAACPARNFYTYDAFIAAANSFGGFGTTGDQDTRKREIAAFLGQTSHETTGGWPTAPDGPYSWGYCFKEEQGNPGSYCQPSTQWPCAPNKKYYGRGPIQISYNFNYGPAGRAIGVNLLNNPDLVATDATISFKTALWFWMTPQSPKPSCHDVITGRWTPSGADQAAGRVPGYGVITNIINGGLECGRGQDSRVADRIGFYQRYCGILGVSPGANLDCNDQRPFGQGIKSAQSLEASRAWAF